MVMETSISAMQSHFTHDEARVWLVVCVMTSFHEYFCSATYNIILGGYFKIKSQTLFIEEMGFSHDNDCFGKISVR